jgi:hypothetical protein
LDEPLSNIPGYTENDREYLNYTYTKNDHRSFEIIANWRKLINEWVDANNEEERVYNLNSTFSINKKIIKYLN